MDTAVTEMIRLSAVAADLERENATLRSDAERYQFLRELNLSEKALSRICAMTGEKMDEAIDEYIARIKGANADSAVVTPNNP